MMFSLLMLSTLAFGQAHIYMLPSSTIVVDGTTEVTYKFQMFSPSFEPVKNYKGIVKLSNGLESSLSSKKFGIYTASFTFDTKTKTEALDVKLTGKVTYVTKEGKITKTVDETFSQHVRGLQKPSYEITSEIKDAIDVTQRLTFEVRSSQNIDPSYISLGTSLGKITDIKQKSPNVLEFKVDDSKKRRFPHYYIIALTDLRFEDVHTTFALPKSGKVSFPIKDVQPKSQVSIKIKDTVFGPTTANSDGKTFVDITVPPGVNKGQTIVKQQASKATIDLDLMIPSTKDVMIFPMLDIPADPNRTFDVYFYTTLENPSIDDFEISTNKGSVGEIRSMGDNKFSFEYTPKYSEFGETDTLVVKNIKTSQKDRLKLQLRAYIPNNTVITTPSSLGKSATQLDVEVSGNYDVQKISRQPNAYVISGKIESLPTELPHKVQISTIGDGPLEITGYYPSTPSTNPFDHLVIDTSQNRIPNDGKSVCLVTVVSVDKYGYPVGNQKFSINKEIGDGTLFGEQKTNTLGFAHLLFRAGSTEGLNLFEIGTEMGQSEVALYQFQNTTATSINKIPFSGTAEMVKEHTFWDNAISSQRIDRENSFDLPLTSQLNPTVEAVGELKIDLQTPRKILAFGERVELTFEIKDDSGNLIPVEKPIVFAEAGQLTGLENPSGGIFSTTLVVPEEGLDTLEISVQSGDISQDFLFSVAETGDAVADANSFDEEEELPKEKRVRTPRTNGSDTIDWGTEENPMPWLSATLSYTHGQYSFQQVPKYLDGFLYYKSVTFNSQAEGSNPATSAGYQSNIRVHYPGIPYVGFEYRFHVDRYAIGIPGITAPVVDWLIVSDYLLVAQYPVSWNGLTMYPTLRFGVSTDSILLFLQEEYLEDETLVKTESTSLTSSQVGMGLFVQSDSGAFGEFSYEKGFQGGTYRDKSISTFGYNHKERRSWFVTFRGNIRQLNLSDTDGLDEGTLIDQHMAVGAGFKYRR
jgi:hypothetical protein